MQCPGPRPTSWTHTTALSPRLGNDSRVEVGYVQLPLTRHPGVVDPEDRGGFCIKASEADDWLLSNSDCEQLRVTAAFPPGTGRPRKSIQTISLKIMNIRLSYHQKDIVRQFWEDLHRSLDHIDRDFNDNAHAVAEAEG